MDTALKHFLDTAPGTLCITDPQGVILYVNGAIEKRTGFMPAQAIGLKPGNVWGGHMPRQYYRDLWSTIERERQPFVSAIENKKKNGTIIYDTAHIAPIVRSDKSIAFFMEVHPVDQSASFSDNFYCRVKAAVAGDPEALTLTVLGGWLGAQLPYDIPDTLDRVLRHLLIAPTREDLSDRHDDAVLVVMAQRDSAHFGNIFEKYHEEIQRFFFRRVSSGEVASDLTQDVFIRAYEALQTFVVGNASYKTYLLRIAHNVLVNFYRKKGTVPLEDDCLFVDPISESYGQICLLWNQIGTLSEIEQTVLELKYKKDWSIQEIAGHLNKTENAIKLHLSRSRKKLRDLLHD